MTKRLLHMLAAVCAVALLIGALPTTTLTASADVFEDFTYSIQDGAAVITGYTGSETSLTIPGTIADYPVKIGKEAFEDNETLQAVIIEDGVTAIGVRAFYRCRMLASIVLPDSVTEIGGSAFTDTAYYDDDTRLEEGVLYIGRHLIRAKEYWSVPDDYTVKEGTLTIADEAFYSCNGLRTIIVPAGVTHIGNNAFAYCTSLQSVEIGKDVVRLGDYVFAYDGGLKAVAIPVGVTRFGHYMFYNCQNLRDVFYCGTASEWAQISISEYGNDMLQQATIHYTEHNIVTYDTGEARLILQMLTGGAEIADEQQAALDLNHNGVLDAGDVRIILMTIV